MEKSNHAEIARTEGLIPAASSPVRIQTKLSIGAVDDPLEHEADAMADKVMRMPESAIIQRKCAACRDDEDNIQRKPLASFIQRKESSGGMLASEAVSSMITGSRGGGHHMDSNTQSFMQSRFGTDFSDVKIHTGNESVQMNRELNAKAFTVGSDIYFNEGQYNPDSHEGKYLISHELTHVLQQGKSKQIQRTPQVGNFGPHRYCGFGVYRVPGFIKNLMTSDYEVDYYGGCWSLMANAWSSIWELYDASDRRIDNNTQYPVGTFDIKSSKINTGVPSDGGPSKWSIWYRIDRSNPWPLDYFGYDYEIFDVYSEPIRNPNTVLIEETGPIVWQDNFTPAEDGASIEYDLSYHESRTTTNTQTTEVSGTISGENSNSFGIEYNGLTGGFSNRLGFSATASISRSHSLSIQRSRTESKKFSQPNLKAGVTYKISARPLYHVISGNVGLIPHRNGVITSGNDQIISGSIRILKGIDLRIEGQPPAVESGRWSCDASCNVEGTESQCTGRVTGSSSGHPDENTACREAKRNATQKAPRGCYARHCQCNNCRNR